MCVSRREFLPPLLAHNASCAWRGINYNSIEGALRRNDDDQLRPLTQVALEPRMEANREGFKGDRKKGRPTSSPAKCIMHLASSSPRMVGGLIRR